MKAYELMYLAAKEPEKYEGKKYKLIEGIIMDYYKKDYDDSYSILIDDNGYLNISKIVKSGIITSNAFISNNTELEEIIEPKILTFEEAWNLPLNTIIKPITGNGLSNFIYSLDWWKKTLGKTSPSNLITLTQAKWEIVE